MPPILEKSVLFILYYERNWYFISKFIKINEESRKWRNFQRLAQSLASFCCKNPACDVLLLLLSAWESQGEIPQLKTEFRLGRLVKHWELTWELTQLGLFLFQIWSGKFLQCFALGFNDGFWRDFDFATDTSHSYQF